MTVGVKISRPTASFLFAAIALFPGPSSGAQGPRTLHPLAPPMPLAAALDEVSGLAPAGAASVYAHNDEQATVFELDVDTGKVLRSFSLGRPPLTGDFEAILARDGAIALITSKGVIAEAPVGAGNRTLRYRAIDTGLGETCEIEGYAPGDISGAFFVACKRSNRRLVVYRWSLEGGAEQVINLSLQGAVPNPDDFRVSDLVRDLQTKTLLVLDSGAGAILEVTMAGESVGYWRLGGAHPQAEGLALLADGRLVVADEGSAGKRSRSAALTLYPPRQ